MVDFRGSMEVEGASEISPEVPIVQPVIDRSGEIMGNALGNAFAAIGGAVKQHRSNLAATSQMNTLNNYRMESLRISNAVAQGQMTPAQANTAFRNLYSTTLADNPAIGPDLDTLHAKLLAKGGVAHIAVEGTDEYQREKAFADEAAKHNLTVDEYKKQLDVANALKLETDELATLKTKDEREAFIKNSGIKQKLQKFSETALPAYERDLAEAIAAIDADPENAFAILDQFNKEYAKQKRAIQSLAGDMDIDYLFVPFDDLKKELEDYATGTTKKKVFETRKQAIEQRNQFLIQQNPEVAKSIAINELFKGNVAVLTKLNPETMKTISKLGGEGAPEGYKRSEGLKMDPAREQMPSVLNDTEKPKPAADLSKATIDLVKDANANSGDVAKTGAAMKMLDNTVQSVVDNSGIIGTPKQLTSVIETLGDEAVNEMVVREGGVSPATAKAAKEVIRKEYEGPFLEAVDEIWEDGQFQETITIDQALKGEGQGEEVSKVQVKEVIEPVWTENGVRFEVKPEFEDNKDVHKARAAAERLNTGANSVAKPMNRLIKAQATLEGTSDYKSIYERDYAKRLVPMEDVQGPSVQYPEITEEDFNDLKGMMSPAAVQHYEEQIKAGKMKEKSFFEKADDFAEKILGEPDPDSPAGKLIAEDEAKKDREILEGISKADSANIEMMHTFTGGEGGANAMNKGTSGGEVIGSKENGELNGRPVSENSVGDIMGSQARGEAFAVGSIQIIPSTLKQAVAAGVVGKDEIFNEATQAKVFEYLVTEKRPKLGAYIDGKSDDWESAMLEAAKEFASWPDPRTGKSYYWKSGNKAQVGGKPFTREMALEKLVEMRKARQKPAPAMGSGLLEKGPNKIISDVDKSKLEERGPSQGISSKDFDKDKMLEKKPSSTFIPENAGITPVDDLPEISKKDLDDLAKQAKLPPEINTRAKMREAMTKQEPTPRGLAVLDRGGNSVREGRVTYIHKNQVAKMKPELRKNLSDTAEALGMDLIIKSGYRSPSKNAAVGGARLSQHMAGGAADISIAGMPTEKRVALVRELIKRGAKRVGVYSGNTGLHVDYGTAGLDGKKKAHFMFNKYNRNMEYAPSWWKNLEKEFE